MKKKNLGVALSGGSIRGLAHIGFLDILEEQHIPIDYIIGTSMGALVGGLYAAGKLDEFKKGIVHMSKNKLLTLLLSNRIRKGKADTKRIEKILKKYLGNKRIENLPIPFTAVATDLKTGKEVFLEKGSLLKAIMASIAIPGIFEPIKMKNMLLVDGGVIDPLPSGHAKKRAKKVISVNAMPSIFHHKKNASRFDIISESVAIITGQVIRGKRDPKNLFIQFRTGKVGSFEFESVEKAIRIGKSAAKRNLKKIIKFYQKEI